MTPGEGQPRRDPGSFRDPSGRIFHLDGRVLRTVMPAGAAAFRAARDSGLLRELADAGLLLGWREVEAPPGLDPAAAHVLEHPRLAFVSHPYEWPFAALKAAALLHLDVHLKALARGMTLSDATAYNLQFDGARPVFIDHLSFRPYRDGEFWLGHRQFCEQFLNPLLLQSRLGVPYQEWYRARLSGIPGPELQRLMPWWRCLSPLVLLHLTLPALLQGGGAAPARAARPPRPLPLSAFRNLLEGLRRGIEGLQPRAARGEVWTAYAGNTSYRSEEAQAKHAFVRGFVEDTRPSLLWDLGCNTGDYSATALAAGAKQVIGFEGEAATANAAFARAQRENLRFLPLVMDLTNPSPSQGWNEAERGGLRARARPDALVALAVLHHVVIQGNVPLEDAVDWLVNLAPAGVIEFVPRGDPMVQRLLSLREDVFADYTVDRFLTLLAQRASIQGQHQITTTGRMLVAYRTSP